MAQLPQIPRRFVSSEFTGNRYRGDASVFSPYRELGLALEGLGGDLQAISEDYQRERAADAQDQGAHAVERDENGRLNVAFRSNVSQSGRAYNQAAKTAYMARLAPEVRTKLSQLASEYEGRPEEFASVTQQYISEVAGNAAENDHVLQGPITALVEQEASRVYEGIVQRKHNRDLDEFATGISNEVNVLIDDGATLARAGGTNTQDFAETRDNVRSLLDSLSQNPELKYTPADAEETLRKAEQKWTESALTGIVERTADGLGAEAGLRAVEEALNATDLPDFRKNVLRRDWQQKVMTGAADRLVAVGDYDGARALVGRMGEVVGEDLDPDSVTDRIVGAESSGDPNAKAKTSSAAGLGQFTEETWIEAITRHRPDLVEGKTRAQVLMMRYDADTSREMTELHAQDNALALNSAGFEATPGNVYLAHFAGKSGAVALLKASPDTPVEDVLTASAIKANKFLKGKTAGEVIEWAAGKMGDLPTSARAATRALSNHIEANILKAEREKTASLRGEASAAHKLVEADISSVTETGQGMDEISFDKIATVLGEQDALAWQDKREAARATYEATNDMPELTEAEIEARVNGLEPKSGQAGFAEAEALYRTAEKEGDRIIKLRRDDPAGAVRDDARVEEAAAALDPENPQTVNALIDARMQAQADIGIPEFARRPLPKHEASSLAALIQGMQADDPRDLESLQKIMGELNTSYGRHAPAVLRQMLEARTRNRELAETSAVLLEQITAGKGIDPAAAAAFDEALENDAAEKAVTGEGVSWLPIWTLLTGGGAQVGAGAASDGEGEKKEGTGPAKQTDARKPQPSWAHIQMLLDNPTLADQFDVAYGPGASSRYLAKAQ